MLLSGVLLEFYWSLIFPIWNHKAQQFLCSFFILSYHETNSNLSISHAAKNKVFSRYYSYNVGNFRGLYVWGVKPLAETERSCVKHNVEANIAIGFGINDVVAGISEIERDIVKWSY